LRRTFSPPKVDRGPWETYIEAGSIGMGTTRQCVSTVIRFEEEPSPTEEKEKPEKEKPEDKKPTEDKRSESR